MSKENALNIIKGAILLERRGKSFYQTVAEQAKNQAVAKIFNMMAEEEDQHIKILTDHFRKLEKDGTFASLKYSGKPSEVSASVLTEVVQKDISAAGYEAAAISAAIAMEDRAVNFYADRATSTDDPLEKELYDWLANWEKSHLKLLADIDKELVENVWYDNRFWPMV